MGVNGLVWQGWAVDKTHKDWITAETIALAEDSTCAILEVASNEGIATLIARPLRKGPRGGEGGASCVDTNKVDQIVKSVSHRKRWAFAWAKWKRHSRPCQKNMPVGETLKIAPKSAATLNTAFLPMRAPQRNKIHEKLTHFSWMHCARPPGSCVTAEPRGGRHPNGDLQDTSWLHERLAASGN